ncbi:MAG: FeoA family protein [Acidaminococcaceae bacterium]
MMPLTMAGVGEKHSIRKVTGQDQVRQHLAELGFVAGTEVTVISKIGGNLILAVKASRIGLDQTLANRIMI